MNYKPYKITLQSYYNHSDLRMWEALIEISRVRNLYLKRLNSGKDQLHMLMILCFAWISLQRELLDRRYSGLN